MAHRIPVPGDKVLVRDSDPYYAGDRGEVIDVEPDRASQHRTQIRFTDGGEDWVDTANLTITKDSPQIPAELRRK